MNAQPQCSAITFRPVPRDGSTLVLRRRPIATEPPPVITCADAVLEAKLLAILDAPLSARETPTAGFDRKERALGNAFAELTRAQAGALFDRLEINYTRDDLARKFHKLTDVRRDRLMTFLARVAECA